MEKSVEVGQGNPEMFCLGWTGATMEKSVEVGQGQH